MLVSLIIALILTLVICCLLKLKPHNIVTACIISVIVVSLLENLYNYKSKIDNTIVNTFNDIKQNKILSLKEAQKIENIKNNNRVNLNTKIAPYAQIIHPKGYNQDDCTTDMTCIQKADKNNLFVGFDKKVNLDNLKQRVNFIETQVEKMEDTINSLEDNGIITEHFDNNNNPHKLNDLVKPFDKRIINAYDTLSNQKKIKHDLMETDGLCFHGKIGVCNAGVCKGIDELQVDGKESFVQNKIIENAAHPHSINFPLIRSTNPGQIDFE